MTEDKKGFILYKDLIHTVEKMPDDKAGQLLKHILSYVNDKDPETDDLIIQLTFEPIKQQLKRDFKKYKNKLDGKSNAGKIGNLKRWHNDLFEDYDSGKITLDEALLIAENRKQSHSDDVQSQTITKIALKDTVTDTDTVKDKVKDKLNNINDRKLKFSSTLSPYLNVYGKDMLNDFYKYWTEPNQSNTKFKKELEKTWSLERRLETWAKNDKNFKNNGKQFTKPNANEALENRLKSYAQSFGVNQEPTVSETISERTSFDDYEEIP
jgi:hypothetical protein